MVILGLLRAEMQVLFRQNLIAGHSDMPASHDPAQERRIAGETARDAEDYLPSRMFGSASADSPTTLPSAR